MNGRRASLAGAYDPGRAAAWRTIAFVLMGAATVCFGMALGWIVAHALNTGVWTVPLRAWLAAVVAFAASVMTIRAANACTAAIMGPPDEVVYPTHAPTVQIPARTVPTVRYGGVDEDPS